jgi:Sulfatase
MTATSVGDHRCGALQLLALYALLRVGVRAIRRFGVSTVAFSKYLPDDESMYRLAAEAVTDRCDEFVTPQNAAGLAKAMVTESLSDKFVRNVDLSVYSIVNWRGSTDRGGTIMMRLITSLLALGLLTALGIALVSAQSTTEPLDRTVLPIPEPERPLYTELDARQVKPPTHFEVEAPASAPNVVIVLIDDLGFGAPSAFGGPITTPTLDTLAHNGLRYTNFHTTALCSPTRAATRAPLAVCRPGRINAWAITSLPVV